MPAAIRWAQVYLGVGSVAYQAGRAQTEAAVERQGRQRLPCARCGGHRFIPLTFDPPPIDEDSAEPAEIPERPYLKCVGCGERYRHGGGHYSTPLP